MLFFLVLTLFCSCVDEDLFRETIYENNNEEVSGTHGSDESESGGSELSQLSAVATPESGTTSLGSHFYSW